MTPPSPPPLLPSPPLLPLNTSSRPTLPPPPPGYVNFSSTHHDWSDGFRLVRKEKYGSSDGLSSDYKALLAVGGLHGSEHLWPPILKDYMQVGICVRRCWFGGWGGDKLCGADGVGWCVCVGGRGATNTCGLGSDYKALLAVGGLHGHEHLWPPILKDYMQVRAHVFGFGEGGAVGFVGQRGCGVVSGGWLGGWVGLCGAWRGGNMWPWF
jgi:hypothetical protein